MSGRHSNAMPSLHGWFAMRRGGFETCRTTPTRHAVPNRQTMAINNLPGEGVDIRRKMRPRIRLRRMTDRAYGYTLRARMARNNTG